jgi:hypothetical protein
MHGPPSLRILFVALGMMACCHGGLAAVGQIANWRNDPALCGARGTIRSRSLLPVPSGAPSAATPGLPVIYSQQFLKRCDFGALLEPQDTVANGAGQSPDAFIAYWDVMKPENKPCVYMDYVGLSGISEDWTDRFKAEHFRRLGKFIVPQVGLAMTLDSSQSHYEGRVAAGLLDADIDRLVAGLRKLAIPVYLRIGYEFNGLSWNGYQPETYKQAFIRITNRIRAEKLEVATVWHLAADGVGNFMDYYPGDEYVDWWGISLFAPAHFSSKLTLSFLDSAVTHRKPVLIGESTPRHVGVLQGQTSWNAWFVPFFDLIHARPEIKMFCYINWNWADYPQWFDWGDCRLQQNSIVSGHFTEEMDLPLYLHAASEREFRAALGYQDMEPPSAVTNLTCTLSPSSALLHWDEASDSSGIARYVIYKNKDCLDYSLTPSYEDTNISAGERTIYSIAAVDKAGNLGPASRPLQVTPPATVEKIRNGEFDAGFSAWTTPVWGGAASFLIDATAQISGKNSARIKISNSSGTNWHIQLRQRFEVRRGKRYTIRYWARANRNLSMETWVQMDHDPYLGYAQKTVALTTRAQSFSDVAIPANDDVVQLAFMVGGAGLAEIWIDGVCVLEQKVGTAR